MIKLKAPTQDGNITHGSESFDIINGIVEVPDSCATDLVKHHGFQFENAPEGEKPPVAEPAKEDDTSLLGSSVQPSTYELEDGSTIQLGDVVRMAFDEAGAESAKEWNALPDSDREEYIQIVVDGLQLKKAPSADVVEKEAEEITAEDAKVQAEGIEAAEKAANGAE